MQALARLFGVCLVVLAPHVVGLAQSPNQPPRVIWRDPGPIAVRDLFWGAGSEARAPKPPFAFVEEDSSGTKPKVVVTDAAGIKWTVKLAPVDPRGNEVHAEIAAGRLIWAFGYFIDEHYFVPQGRIQGVKDLKRAATVVSANGEFRTARFERKGAELEFLGDWDIEKNPFEGTRELSGLQILMELIANWDTPTHNQSILRAKLPNGALEDRYLVSDVGSTFGRMKGGTAGMPSRWNLEDYADGKFVTGVVKRTMVQFNSPIRGNTPLIVPIEHARWFSALASQLTPQQVRQAFVAAGATAAEADGFSNQVRQRLDALRKAVTSPEPPSRGSLVAR